MLNKKEKQNRNESENFTKPFYVYEIYDENNSVVYVGKGIKYRAKVSMKERCGSSYKIVERFEHEHKAFQYEKNLIAKYENLQNKNKGGFGGSVLKGDKESRLMLEIGTKAYAARVLLNYYLTFKALSSKVDKYYTKELQGIFNAMSPLKLYEVGYGGG
jgi:hypothetical protein